jgi:hypothetical protein
MSSLSRSPRLLSPKLLYVSFSVRNDSLFSPVTHPQTAVAVLSYSYSNYNASLTLLHLPQLPNTQNVKLVFSVCSCPPLPSLTAILLLTQCFLPQPTPGRIDPPFRNDFRMPLLPRLHVAESTNPEALALKPSLSRRSCPSMFNFKHHSRVCEILMILYVHILTYSHLFFSKFW